MSGYRLVNSGSKGVMCFRQNDSEAVMRKVPLAATVVALTAASASLISASTALQLRQKCSPASVSMRRRVLRSISRVPRRGIIGKGLRLGLGHDAVRSRQGGFATALLY